VNQELVNMNWSKLRTFLKISLTGYCPTKWPPEQSIATTGHPDSQALLILGSLT